MSELIAHLQRVQTRYRSAVLVRISVVAGLCVALFGAIMWRLHALKIHAGWILSLPAGLLVVTLGALVWWWRRHWNSSQQTAMSLDQTLGLQERLVTAAEFAHAAHLPTLYPFLVQDVEHLSMGTRLQLPKPFSRSATGLLIILLLVLFWPLPGHSPIELAQRTQQSADSRQQTADSNKQQATEQGTQQLAIPATQQGGSAFGGSNQQSPPHNKAGPPSAEATSNQQTATSRQQPANSQQTSADNQAGTSDRQATTGQGTPQPTDHSENRNGQHSSGNTQPQPADHQSRGGQATGDNAPQTMHNQRGADNKTAKDRTSTQSQQQQAQGNAGASASSRSGASQSAKEQRSRQNNQQQAQGNTSSSSSGSQARQSTSAQSQDQGTRGEQGAQSGAQPQGTSAGATASAAGQEALKGEIQALLKEVSGELQQLQEQLASAKEQPKPQIGTSTDPNLYESPTALNKPSGETLPIQLQTDTAATNAQRPGGGVGQPSGTVSHASPKTQAEDAQLSEEPAEELPTTRQSVPPEYRELFDRLHQGTQQPSEQKR